MKWQLEIEDCPKNTDFPIVAHQINAGGVKKGPYYISVADAIHALKQDPEMDFDADGIRANEKSTPTLPFGTIRYSASESGNQQRITMMIPKKQLDIRYGDELNEFHRVGFPRMVIQFLVYKSSSSIKSIKETRLYAIADNNQPITDDTPLYTFPYPNVGKSNGIVCWGGNKRLEIKDLVELERAFTWFISAPFNEDHGIRTTHNLRHFRELINKIADLEFDDEWLLPQRETFGDLFN